MEISKSLPAGSFLVTSAGTDSKYGSVDILLDGRRVMGINERYLTTNLGKLEFYVNNFNYESVSIAVWTCYDRTKDEFGRMRPVWCNPKVIP